MVHRIILILGVLLCIAGVMPPEPEVWQVPPPVPGKIVEGWASQYAMGVMEGALRLRQAWGQIPQDLSDYDGAVAVADCSLVGGTVWIYYNRVWEKFIIADCGSKSDSRWQDGLSGYDWMILLGVLVEVDHETAVRWGCVSRGGIWIKAIFVPWLTYP